MKHFLLIMVMFTYLNVSGQRSLTIQQAVAEERTTFSAQTIPGIQWVKGAESYSIEKVLANDKWIVIVNARTGEEVEILSLSLLNGYIAQTKYINLSDLPEITWINPYVFTFYHVRGYWKYDLQKRTLERIISHSDNAENLAFQYASNQLAYTIDNNLFLANKEEDKIQITAYGEDTIVGQAIHRFEFGIDKGIFWGPEGKALAFYEKDETEVTDYTLLNYGYAPAQEFNIKYPMAGQLSEKARVGIYNTEKHDVVYLKTEGEDDHYLTNLSWDPNGEFVYLAEVNRDQNRMRFNKYRVKDGKLIETLFEETDLQYVEPEQPAFFLKERNGEFLWFSERDGFNHLYHYNTKGKLINQVTQGEFEIHSIEKWIPSSSELIVRGTDSPLNRVLYKINIDNLSMTKITPDPGIHRPKISSSGKYILDSYSYLDIPRQINLISHSGKLIKNVFTAPDPLKDYSIGTTEIFSINSRDSVDLYCRMIRPSFFNPEEKYPVLVYVYGGPHAQLVTNAWLGGASLWMHHMAERGYIIFTLDNRGSANRGIEFEQTVFQGLGILESADQGRGIEYLHTLPYVDYERIAVHGWSFGGHMTLSLMTRLPELFKVGVAGGPVVDWSLYEVMYTERYMDMPQTNQRGYEITNLTESVKNLKGDLMLIHGTSDDIVVMQHSMLYLNRCINEGKQVDFFVYPGHGHNVRGQDRVHLMTKVLDYIHDKLHD